MAKKSSIKVRLVPESKPNSPYFYYVKKPSAGEKAKIKLKVKNLSEEDMVISIGSTVRVIRTPYFGKVGQVTLLPSKLMKMESETIVRVAEVEFSDGKKAIIPRANLEMILE